MKIATYNVNGINSRLPRLLEWLGEAQPDVACLQEIKTSDETFPIEAIEAAGYCADLARPEGLQRRRGAVAQRRARRTAARPAWRPGRHAQPLSAGRGRRLVVASIYLPNGNPQPGPKFDYKLAWFDRLIAHAATLIGQPRAGAADRRLQRGRHRRRRGHLLRRAHGSNDALLQPESRPPTSACWRRAGPTRSTHCTPAKRSTRSGISSASASERDAGLRIDHLLLNAAATARLTRQASTSTCGRGEAERSRADLGVLRLTITGRARCCGRCPGPKNQTSGDAAGVIGSWPFFARYFCVLAGPNARVFLSWRCVK